jgi:Sulphur transport
VIAVPRLGRPSPVTYGVVAALLAVTLQLGFSVTQPPAYGICMACHGREAANWGVNLVAGTSFPVGGLTRSTPLLTTIGVVFGALAAAGRNGELRWRRVGRGLRSVVLGALIMVAALIALGCPTRMWLRLAYGEPLALILVVSLVLGVVAGTVGLRWRSGRV